MFFVFLPGSRSGQLDGQGTSRRQKWGFHMKSLLKMVCTRTCDWMVFFWADNSCGVDMEGTYALSEVRDNDVHNTSLGAKVTGSVPHSRASAGRSVGLLSSLRPHSMRQAERRSRWSCGCVACLASLFLAGESCPPRRW